MIVFKLFLLFIMFSFVGWMLEVLTVLKKQKVLVNRGFLFGPYCPIYGFGGLLIIILLKKYYSEPYVVFIFSIFIAFILEYTTSLVLELLFHDKWWDYKNEKYNINGRVCLETLIPFGFISLVGLYVLYPFLMFIINLFSNKVLIIVTLLLFFLYMIDSASTIYLIINLKKINYKYDHFIINRNRRVLNSINKDKKIYERKK